LVDKARTVLQDFYKDNDLAFTQKSAQAPPPPPPLPGGGEPYGGAKGESTGIDAILGMIHEDILADIKKAEGKEKEAVEEYEKFVADTKDSIEANNKSIKDMEGEIADCEEAEAKATEERAGDKSTLDAVMKEIKLAEPGCAFITINFEVRKTNRQMEIDGLLNAKAILQGAV